MKKARYVTLLLVMVSVGFSSKGNGEFTGEIMDKQCALMKSHDNMMKPERASNSRECTLNCVRDGGSFALFELNTKKVYPLEDEKKIRQYAGQRVQITGTYDEDADVLHVKSIAPAAK